MNKLKFLVVLALMLVGAASVSAQATPEVESTPAAQANAVITLERTACFGRCPVYTVSILADGTVLYNGGQFVDVTGEQQGAIDPAVVAQMVEALDKVGYFGWNENYDHMDVTDLSYVTTSATKDGVTHTVRHYLGDFSAPAELSFVEYWIDLMAGTGAWTGAQPNGQFSVNGNSPVATLQREPCFGNCPVYRVALYADGTVIYTGLAHVDNIGVTTYHVDPNEVDAVVQQAQALGFFSWKEAYIQMVMTDQAYVTTSITAGDQSREIRRYDGDPNAPVGLTWIEDNIDRLVSRLTA